MVFGSTTALVRLRKASTYATNVCQTIKVADQNHSLKTITKETTSLLAKVATEGC